MALDVDPVRLGLESKHTKSWCRLRKLRGSLVEKTQVMAWVEIRDDLIEEKREELR